VFSSATGLAHRLGELTTLFRMIHPQAAGWTQRQSSVPALLAECPVAGLMPTRGAAVR
jgi:hypothetical protein